MAVPHEEVDQALGPLGVGFDVFQGLLPLGRDPGGEQNVGVARTRPYEFDGHLAAELDLWAVVGLGPGSALRHGHYVRPLDASFAGSLVTAADTRRDDIGGDMDTFLWVLQAVLAAVFLSAGVMHATQPRERLLTRLPCGRGFLRVDGAVHRHHGARRRPGTCPARGDRRCADPDPIAATGLAVVMLGALLTHVRRREPGGIAVTGVLLALTVVVAWGRFGPYPL